MSITLQGHDPQEAQALTQRLDALETANKVRIKRARLKEQIVAKEVSIGEVVLDPPDYCRSMRLMTLLVASPKLGRHRASVILEVAGVGIETRLGELSVRQRLDVVDGIPGYAMPEWAKEWAA